MLIVPTSKIILLKNPIEIDYMNELSFATKTDQYNYFYSLPKLECNNATYQRKDEVVSFPTDPTMEGVTYDDLVQYNYCMYQNDKWSNKWFYAFVKEVIFDNPGMSYIKLETDVWQSWCFDITFKNSFIEREHVNDDTIGKHTIPEGLETGDFIVNSLEEFGNNVMNTKRIAMAYTGNPQSLFPSYGSGKEYTGLYTGFNYMVFGSSQDADEMIQGFSDNGALDKIYMFFTIPTGLLRSSIHYYNGPNATGSDVIEIGDGNYPMFALVPEDPVGSHNEITMLSSTNFNINTTINGYTPKNNKLFTGEFNYIYATNNNGGDIKLNYEDFINNQPSFKIIGAISLGCAIKLVPMNYKKFDTTSATNGTYVYGLNASKYPTLGWVGDAYTNWLTQNAINIGVGAIGNIAQIIGGGAMLAGGVTAVAGASSMFSGFSGILNQMGEIRKHYLVSETGNGNINAGDLTFSSKKMNFTLYRMSIKEEYAKIIDNYFNMFGYKVNSVKLPNITGRTYWNYVKTIGCNLIGDIPQQDLEKIKEIFNNGVTMWHKPSYFLDYSQNNTIVT